MEKYQLIGSTSPLQELGQQVVLSTLGKIKFRMDIYNLTCTISDSLGLIIGGSEECVFQVNNLFEDIHTGDRFYKKENVIELFFDNQPAKKPISDKKTTKDEVACLKLNFYVTDTSASGPYKHIGSSEVIFKYNYNKNIIDVCIPHKNSNYSNSTQCITPPLDSNITSKWIIDTLKTKDSNGHYICIDTSI